MEKEMNLKSLLEVFKNYLAVLIAITLLFGVASFTIFSLIRVNTYTAVGMFICNSRGDFSGSTSPTSEISSGEIDASTNLSQTIVSLLSKDAVLDKAADFTKEQYGYTYSGSQIRTMITASNEPDTFIINLYVTATDPLVASNIANAIGAVADDVVKDALPGGSLTYFIAKVPTGVNSSHIFIKTAIGALAGFLIVVVAVFIKYFADDRIKMQEDIFNKYNVSVMGIIPSRNLRK